MQVEWLVVYQQEQLLSLTQLRGSGGCSAATATRTVTVTAAPSAGTLSGTQAACVGGTTTFTSTVNGGSWSSSNTAVATVNASGVVSGVSAGTATITYTVAGSGGCAAATATRTVTVSTGGVTSKCFSATLVGTPVYNATAKTTTFTYDVCAKNCGSGLSHVAFITATNIGVVSPKNGATYITAKFSYRVTVPVSTTIWGIKFDVTNKEGIKGTNCDRFIFTMAGNVPVSAITEIQFKAGGQVTTQTSTGGCGGSTTQKMSSAITAVQSTVGPTLEIPN
jgi:hypothetical protein